MPPPEVARAKPALGQGKETRVMKIVRFKASGKTRYGVLEGARVV